MSFFNTGFLKQANRELKEQVLRYNNALAQEQPSWILNAIMEDISFLKKMIYQYKLQTANLQHN
jgi:predicted amidophosphoribosyltransferase